MQQLPFSDRDTTNDAAIYIAFLGAVYTGMVYIESERNLAHGCIAGAIGIGILLAIGALVRTRREFE